MSNRKKQMESGDQKPVPLTPDFAHIPDELKTLPQWVVWDYHQKDGKWSKVPLESNGTRWAKSNDKSTWSSFDAAQQRYERGNVSGIGFVFDGLCGITGLDVDCCISDGGELSTIAESILQRFDTYAEISPSGTGIKLWVKGDIRPLLSDGKSGRKRGDFEAYTADRFFAVTGHVVGNHGKVNQNQQQENLQWFLEEFVQKKQSAPAAKQQLLFDTPADESRIWESLKRSSNGPKIMALMSGDISAYAGDDSRADMALATYLAWWFGPSADRVESAFRLSKLAEREKWKAREDYRRDTIGKAIALQKGFYRGAAGQREQKPKQQQEPRPKPGPPKGPAANVTNLVRLSDNNSHRLASMFMEQYGYYDQLPRLRFWQEDMYRWELSRNYYYPVPEPGLRAELGQFIHRVFQEDAERKAERTNEPATVMNVTSGLVTNVIAALRGMTLLKPELVPLQPAWLGHPEESKPWVAVQNGLLDIESIQGAQRATKCLDKPTPLWFSPTCLPVIYDPHARCPIWLRFVDQTFQGDLELIGLLQEWFGYCLTHDTKFQKFMMMVSEGGQGKGVIAGALETLIGNRNMSFVPLEQFGERFALYPTIGKNVNLIADANEIDRVAEGHLKSFVVGDRMNVDRKNRDPIDVRPTAKLMIFANKLPFFGDRTQGVWRRMILLELKATVAETDRIAGMDKPEFWMEHPGERPGMLNWAIEGLLRLRQRDRFTTPESVKHSIERHKAECSTPMQYLQEHCEAAEGEWVDTERLYQQYCNWAKAGNYRVENARKFGKEVFKLFPVVMKERPREGNRYSGLRMKSDIF